MHILQRGPYIPHKWLSKAWAALTGNYVVGISAIRKQAGAVLEVTKYLTKSAAAISQLSPGRPPYTHSRGWLPEGWDDHPDDQPRDPYAAYFAIKASDALRILANLGASVAPLPDRPNAWCVAWPRPPDVSLIADLPYFVSESEIAFALYSCWRWGTLQGPREGVEAELCNLYGVRCADWARRRKAELTASLAA